MDRVKRSESGMILNPITLGADAKLRDAHALMARFSIDRDTAFRVVCDWVDDQAAERATPLPAVRRSRSPARRSV